jgi:hypothetical protein
MSCFIVCFLTNKKLNKQFFDLAQMMWTSCIHKEFILVSTNYIVRIDMFCSSVTVAFSALPDHLSKNYDLNIGMHEKNVLPPDFNY